MKSSRLRVLVLFMAIGSSVATGVAQQGGSSVPYEAVIPESKVGLSPSYGSLIPLKDGRLLWIWGIGRARKPLQPFQKNISTDGGRTWSDPTPLRLAGGQPLTGVFNANLVRLRSGNLGLFLAPDLRPDRLAFHVSSDEGETWSEGVEIGTPPVYTTGDKAIVLKTGRIVIPVYGGLSGPKLEVAKPKLNIHGEKFGLNNINGFWYSYTYFSDDEGKTWKRSTNEVFILYDKGMKGLYGAGEPALVELKDGSVMMFLRTSLMRVFRSLSPDGGNTWLEPEPTPLVSPPAPTSLGRIPSTGDLLVIWQQVSNYEGMIGLYRHRLTAAISKDDGKTWQNHRNLESLDDTAVIEGPVEPSLNGVFRQPLDRKRYHRAPAPLRCSYPTLTFLGDTAVITYGLSSLGEESTLEEVYKTNSKAVFAKLGLGDIGRANKVRVLPVSWFYEPAAPAVAQQK
jgi:sialidase-1